MGPPMTASGSAEQMRKNQPVGKSGACISQGRRGSGPRGVVRGPSVMASLLDRWIEAGARVTYAAGPQQVSIDRLESLQLRIQRSSQ